MKNRIDNLEIKNFKSLKHVKLKCKRINIFIGKPNVGKSNLLEVLSLFIAPYCDPNKKFLEDYVRYEKLRNLFYDQNRKNSIEVITDLGFASLRYHMNSINQYDIIIGSDLNLLEEMKETEMDSLNDYNDIFNESVRHLNIKEVASN